MKKTFVLIAMALAMAVPITAASAVPVAVWDQGFETDTHDWSDSDDGWLGTIERVASGTDGIASADGSWHATIDGDPSGPFSVFDRVPTDTSDTEWPGDWTAELDVYLDPTWEAGAAFDYDVYSRASDSFHLQDYIFHIESYGPGDLRVGVSNNSNWGESSPDDRPQGNLDPANAIDEAGWYTLQHRFHDDGTGVLAVDMNVLDADGSAVFAATLPTETHDIATEVGGTGAAWFTFSTVDGLAIDNHQLFLQGPETKDDCKKGGHEDFYGVYSNQGECVSDVATDGKKGNQGKAKGKNK